MKIRGVLYNKHDCRLKCGILIDIKLRIYIILIIYKVILTYFSQDRTQYLDLVGIWARYDIYWYVWFTKTYNLWILA